MRLSHSAKETYLECGYKYYLHYLMKLRPQGEKSPLIFGDAIDHALNHILEHRDLAKAKKEFDSKWAIAAKKDVQYSKSDVEDHLVEELEEGLNKAWHSLQAKAYIMLEEYEVQILPRIKRVIEVQLNRFIDNGTGDQLNIKTDFICEWEDGRIILFDNKTSSMKYEEDSVRTSKQLSTYFEMLKDDYKLDACGYIVIPKKINKKKKPKIDIKIIIDQIPEETIAETFTEYDKVLAGVKAAEFPKNKNACFGKFGKCVYWDYCHRNDKTGLAEKT